MYNKRLCCVSALNNIPHQSLLSVWTKAFDQAPVKCSISPRLVAIKAKMESDRLIVSVGKKAPQETGIKVKNHSSALSLAHRRDFKQLLQGIAGEGPLRLVDINFKEFAGFQIALLNKVDLGEKGHLWKAWHSLCGWKSYRKNRASVWCVFSV